MKKFIFCILLVLLVFSGGLINANGQENNITSNKLIFGIAADPLFGLMMCGPTLSFDFTKNNLYAQIYLLFPVAGLNAHIKTLPKFYDWFEVTGADYGFGAAFNKLYRKHNGSFYIGGMLELQMYYMYLEAFYPSGKMEWIKFSELSVGIVLNLGYILETPSGLYFRFGGQLGVDYNYGFGIIPVARPDISIGYSFLKAKK